MRCWTVLSQLRQRRSIPIAVTLFLFDKETNELYSRVAQGDAEIRIPSTTGIAGGVFTAGVAVIIPDAYADDRFNQEVDRKTGYRARNIMGAPIRTRT